MSLSIYELRQKVGDLINNCVNRNSFTSDDLDQIITIIGDVKEPILLEGGVKISINSIIKRERKQERERIIEKLDNNFLLAPEDSEHLRILVSATLEYLRTGKTSKQIADENYENYKKKK